MGRITLHAVFLILVGQVTSQFYDPTFILRGFGIPYAGFLRRFSTPANCDDPCKSTSCQSGYRCRVVQVNCFRPPCRLLPGCMPDKLVDDDVLMNPCLINRPIMSTSGKELGTCFDSGSSNCPKGSKCTRALYGQGSKCCYAPLGCAHAKTATHRQNVEPVSLTSPPRNCPAPSDHTTCEKGCLVNDDCPRGSVCCPTSCGTRACARPQLHSSYSPDILSKRRGIKPRPVDTSLRRGVLIGRNRGGAAVPHGTIHRQGLFSRQPHYGRHRTNPGSCRSRLHYHTCRDQCTDDSHCGVGKCCPTRCSTSICIYGRTGRYLG